MKEILNQLKEYHKNYTKLEDRNTVLEGALEKLLSITGTDNYGNLIKRVTKLSKRSETFQDEYWWFCEPDHWYQGYKINKKDRRNEALRLTGKCLEKYYQLNGDEGKNKIISLFQSLFRNEIRFERYKYLFSFMLNWNVTDEQLDAFKKDPYGGYTIDGKKIVKLEEKAKTPIKSILPDEIDSTDLRKFWNYIKEKNLEFVEDCSLKDLDFLKSIKSF